MAKFIKQHKLVHIWAAGVLAVFCAYWYGASSPEAASQIPDTARASAGAMWSIMHWALSATLMYGAARIRIPELTAVGLPAMSMPTLALTSPVIPMPRDP